MNSSSRTLSAHLIGDAVMTLLKSKRRVTVGNILDIMEHKKRTVNGCDKEELRNAIIYIRKNGNNM